MRAARCTCCFLVPIPDLRQNPAKALAMSTVAKRTGADAVLVTVPFYNKPGQGGIVAHFETLAQGAELPIIIHNAPDRTAIEAGIDTLASLAVLRSIVGVVDHDPGHDRLARKVHPAHRVPRSRRGRPGGPLHRLMGGDGWLSQPRPFSPRI